MKAFTKLLSLLLLVAMCMSFMAVPAYAAGTSQEPVGRVTADMMNAEPEFEPEPEPASTESAVVNAAEGSAQPVQSAPAAVKTVRAVVQKADGSELSFESLASALANAASGDVVVVKADASFGSTLVLDKKITIVNHLKP